jgi:hypothetical protein
VLILASFYGVFAGLAGIEHGIFKLLQGNVRADGIMIELIDLSYQPVLVSNALKPASDRTWFNHHDLVSETSSLPTIRPSPSSLGTIYDLINVYNLTQAITHVQPVNWFRCNPLLISKRMQISNQLAMV